MAVKIDVSTQRGSLRMRQTVGGKDYTRTVTLWPLDSTVYSLGTTAEEIQTVASMFAPLLLASEMTMLGYRKSQTVDFSDA